MKKQFKFTFLFISLAFLTFNSCGMLFSAVASNSQITEEKGAIPPTFGKEKTVPIFITHDSQYNKKLRKYLKEYYHGEFKLMSESKFRKNKAKYIDDEEYKYVFDYMTSEHAMAGTKVTATSATGYHFFILDLNTGKIYKPKIYSSSYGGMLKAYIKKLEEKRTQY